MLERLKTFYKYNIRQILGLLVLLALILWVLSQFIKPFEDWLLQHQVFDIIILAFVAQILVEFVEFKRDFVQKSIKIYSHQQKSSKELIEYIDESKPKNADLIELGSTTVDDVISALCEVNCKIRLLIQHPDSAINNYQKERIQQRIRELKIWVGNGEEQIEVRLYSVPCSIRGRLIGNNLINLGWYTYTNEIYGIHGHDNPLITVPVGTPEGAKLYDFFKHSFNTLWDHPKTIPIDEFKNFSE